ncbi:hypothetical protein BOX15_Mlig002144g1, partial [Macrostomum lignano]
PYFSTFGPVQLTFDSNRMSAIAGMSESIQPDQNDIDDSAKLISSAYQQVNHGINETFHYEVDKKNADFQGVFYNERNREFLAMDANGILQVKPQSPNKPIQRIAHYPKYEYSLLSQLIYYRQYNIYFALNKQSALLVLNRFFEEMVPVTFEQRNVLAMIFDKSRDQLITNGAYGTKFWVFQPKTEKHLMLGKAMSNYELKLIEHLEDLGGSWVKYVDIDYNHDHLYYCSETDVRCYSLSGFDRAKLLFKLDDCHRMEITGCLFSNSQQLLVTSSMDTEVKLWNTKHGFLTSFLGHSQGITGMYFYPGDESRIITASLDGSVRLWSLALQECQMTVQALHSDPVIWSGMAHQRLMFVASTRQFALLHINYLPVYWSECRSQATRLSLVGTSGGICGATPQKSTRLLALCEDSSVRLYSRRDGRLLSSLLTPPDVSPLDRVLDVCHSRATGLTFVLLDGDRLWVYFAKSNPACRLHAWTMKELHAALSASSGTAGLSIKTQELAKSQRASDYYQGGAGGGQNSAPRCLRLALLRSHVIRWTLSSLALECPLAEELLLLGLSDGRVLFLDPTAPAGKLHLQLQAHRGPVTRLAWDEPHECLLTGTENKGVLTLAVWNLPHLQLMSEIRLPDDCCSLTRCASALVSGHASGHVIRTRVATGDRPSAAQRAATRPDLDAALPRTPEHSAAVVAVDSLLERDLLASVDASGHIKIWQGAEQPQLTLLVELNLLESLTAAGFLNSRGDLLLSMRNHLFLLPFRRYLPQVVWPEAESTEDDDNGSIAESDILEDPAVVHEGIQQDPNPIDYDSYLAPFSVKLIKDYLNTSEFLAADLLSAREAEEERKRTEAEAAANEEGESNGEPEDDEEESSCSLTSLLISASDRANSALADGSTTSLDLEQLAEATQNLDQEVESLTSQRCWQLPHFGESPGAVSVSPEPSETPTPPEQPQQQTQPEASSEKPLTPQPLQSKPAAAAPQAASRPDSKLIQSFTQQQQRQQQPKPAAPSPAVLSQQTVRQPLAPSAVSLGSGLPAASDKPKPQRRPAPTKKAKKQQQQSKKKQKATPVETPAAADRFEVEVVPFSVTMPLPDVQAQPSQEQQRPKQPQPQPQPQPQRTSRSLVVEIPSLPILTPKEPATSSDAAGADKRHASDKHPQRPRAALLFSASSRPESATAAEDGSMGIKTDLVEDPTKTSSTTPAPPTMVTEEDQPDELGSLLAAGGSANRSSPTQQLDGYAQLHEQREQLEALRSEYDRLAKKVAADFGSSDGKLPTRQFGLKSLSPEELVSLHSLKRLERGLRERSALQRKAELRLARLASWEARPNHGDCVAPSSSSASASASRSTSRTGTASESQRHRLRSQSATETRLSAFQASREATELQLQQQQQQRAQTPAASASSKRFGALPQTPYRLRGLQQNYSTEDGRFNSRGGQFNRDDAQPANPFSLMRLRHSAASIPSRQYTYVTPPPRMDQLHQASSIDAAVTDAAPLSVPSLAEERLIRRRFPNRVADWVGPGGVFAPKPWTFAIGGQH